MAELAIPLVAGLGSSAMFGAGASFLGVSAFGWGWAIGSMAASYLLAPDQEGPRLSDLSAGGSEYGSAIPLCYGTTKVAGNVIWASDLIETKHTESAKGGPEIETYTYSQHLQVLVCAGEVAGIRKIWANGRLIYDISEANTGASGYSGNIRVYTGSETQVADSLIEAYKGAGNVPAHRGYCHVVFENLQLEDYGNRTPSFEFEVVASGASSTGLASVLDSRGPILADVLQQGCAVALPGGRIAMAHHDATPAVTMIIVDDVAGAVIAESTTPGNAVVGWVEYVPAAREIWMSANSYPTAGTDIIRFNADTGAYVGTYSTGYTNNAEIVYSAHLWRAFVVCGPFSNIYQGVDPATGALTGSLQADYHATVNKFLTGDAVLWTDAGPDWENTLLLIDMEAGVPLATVVSGTLARSSTAVTNELAYDPSRRRAIWTNADSMPNLAVVDVDTLEVSHTTTDAAYTTFLWYNEHTDRYYAFGSPGSGETSVIVLDADTLQQVTEFTVTTGGVGEMVRERMMPSGLPQDYVLTRTADGLIKVPISPRLAANQVALSTIVTDLCERAGLTAADIDVTDLTEMVDGYKTT